MAQKKSETVEKNPETGEKIYSKTRDILQKMENGYDPTDAYKLVTGKDKVSRQQIHNIKKKFDKHSLHRPKRRKAIATATDKVVNDYLTDKRPENASLVVKMALDVEERENPKVRQSQNLNINQTFIDVNLDQFK